MDTLPASRQLTEFRETLYQYLNKNKRADSVFELIDALCSTPSAHSAVELSLSPQFRRGHAALYKAVAACQLTNADIAALAKPVLPPPTLHPYWLFGIDVTAHPRPYAATMSDRTCVYAPTVIKGNKPIALGHQYSNLVVLPEHGPGRHVPWVIPLGVERVISLADKELVGAAQLRAVLTAADLPFHEALCVEVGDTAYSKPAYVSANRDLTHLVTVVRARSNRVFYRAGATAPDLQAFGHPLWYGARFDLKDRTTWGTPDEVTTLPFVSRRGHTYQVVIQAWQNCLMRGRIKPTPIPMHHYPFTLVRVEVCHADGTPVWRHPMWLLVFGERRHQLTAVDVYQAYRQRYDAEHFFRFGKQKLLVTTFQTPQEDHEETWWRLVQVAYLQLWAARPCAETCPRPWEKALPVKPSLSPSDVQRDFARLVRQFGTPARAPKPRGKAPGWPKGTPRSRRQRHPVIKKTAT